MTNAKELARDVLVLKALAERVTAADKATRRSVLDDGDPGDRTAAKLPDGTVIGTVAIARGRLAAKVTDAAALLAHVKETAPTEVQTVEQIRPAFLTKLLAAARDHGEVIPGIELAEGDPYVTTSVQKGAVEAIERAWADGSLPLPAAVLPELEAGR